jgi:hypothetical protein
MNTDFQRSVRRQSGKSIARSCLRKSAFICGSLFVLCLASAAESAQRGGKAEPNRIEFKRGATSTVVSGVVHNEEEVEYVLAAKKGQHLTIKMSSQPLKSSVFQILGPDNDTLGLEYDANFSYSGVLPKTGDYAITVRRPTSSKGASKFKLTITIR